MRALAFAASLCLLSTGASAGPRPDCSVLEGWAQKGAARHFTTDDLFDYMNGNAEGYFAYRFVAMDGVTCVSGEATILIDFSEMADAEYAYGMFAANRDMRRPVESIGMVGQVGERRAVFVKGPFYIELAAQQAGDQTAVLRSFAQSIEATIDGSTELPAALGWFPEEGLQADSVRLVPQSVLGVRELRAGYVAEYDFGRAFVVSEESPEAAEQLLAALAERWQKTAEVAVGDGGFVAEDRYLKGLLVFRKGSRVIGLARLASDFDALPAAQRLAEAVP